MNAAPIPGPTKRADYEPIVKGLRPDCYGEELELRSGLMLIRDRAIATKPISCEPSWLLLDIVEREASAAALNHKLNLEDMRALRRLLIECVCTASNFERLYQPVLPGLEQGEAHGRG